MVQNDRLMHAVAEMLNKLLTVDDFREAIDEALATLGLASQVDRVYIWENHPHDPSGEPAVSQRFEWCNEGVEPQIDNPDLINLPYGDVGLSWWYESLSNHGVINGIVSDMPQAERETLEPQGIVSILVVPIFIKEDFWGFIGFDDCQKRRVWNEEELALLRLAAGSLGGAIARKALDDKMEEFNRSLAEKVEQEIAKNRSKDALILQQAKQMAIGQMIGSIAHQWRQPLNGISLAAGEIAFDLELGSDPQEIKENLKMINDLSQNMSKMMDDFMDFFQMESAQKEFPVIEAIEYVLKILEPPIYRKNINVKVAGDAELTVEICQNSLQQLLINLMNEVIDKIDPSKPEINIGYHLDEQRAFKLVITWQRLPDAVEDAQSKMNMLISSLIVQDALHGQLQTQANNYTISVPVT